MRDGVEIRRLPLSSFGKRSIAIRLLGAGIFLSQAVARGLLVRRLDTVIVSTSPPMAPFAGAMLRAVRRVRLVFWVMDVNPDQMIALGNTGAGSWLARGFDWLIRVALRKADRVIVLDRFMAARINRKHDVDGQARRDPAVAPRRPGGGDRARGQSLPPAARPGRQDRGDVQRQP